LHGEFSTFSRHGINKNLFDKYFLRGNILITGSADATLKVWNFQTRHCEGFLRECSSVPLILVRATTHDDSKNYVVTGQVSILKLHISILVLATK